MAEKETETPLEKEYSSNETVRLRRVRATHKRKITIYLKKLKDLDDKNLLTSSLCAKQIKDIEEELAHVSHHNNEINGVMEASGLSLGDQVFDEEIDGQAEYNTQIGIELDQYEKYRMVSPNANDSVGSLLDMMTKMNQGDGKPPPLECSTFSGTEKDKFAFTTFLNQFNNVIGSRKNLSDSAKQTYLYGYLRDYALKVVKHLSISDDNYKIAIQMLKKEFIDEEYIIDETYKNILKAAPKTGFDPEFTSVKMYLTEIRAYLHELKGYEIDLLEEGTAGHSFISHIIFSKLPMVIKRELVHRLKTNYPTITGIFSEYNEVIKTLSRTGSVNYKAANKPSNKPSTSNYNLRPLNFKDKEKSESRSTVQNYESISTKVNKLYCKLCEAEGHSLGRCNTFISYEEKVERLKELSLCTRCAGSGHAEKACYGKQGKLRFECKRCSKKEHITPLCPQSESKPPLKTNVRLCFAQGSLDVSNMLPTMTLELKNGKKSRKVRCLVDTCSQRSYITEAAAKDLCQDVAQLYALNCDVCTYIGQETKCFKQMSTGIKLENRLVFVPLLVDKTMNITFEVPGMNEVIGKFKQNRIKLLDETFYEDRNHETIEVDMLIGIDILQFMSSLSCKRNGGSCLVIDNKWAPIGNVLNFLTEAERKSLMETRARKSERSLSPQTKTLINLVMDPLKSYFNPLEHILEDSEVDNGLEHLFSLESMGIKKDDKELVSYDQDKVDQFKEGISFQDGYYNVELPWHSDKIDLVPSNHFVALKVLDRTVDHLKKKGLIQKYQEVFDNQLKDGIIEEINVDPVEYDNYIWIPHRPVIKTDEQVTTKIRPVFNCSLKTSKELPSLNEAAYPGIDLMSSILKLILYFRTNNTVMISDIKQAFLMIKLKNEIDKNRFCFFWKRGNQLVAYRYKSIVFGYTSSPFILNYVMKHHAETFPDDKCKEILANNFYVDNLLITGNDSSEMQNLYQLAFDRMKQGGFTLRSWNSNSIELREQMSSDGRLVEHTCEDEKVLGYRYNVDRDTLSISPCNINPEADTKRKILSQISKVYDPLGLVLPVTIRGRILMRKIWKLDVGWDDKVPKEICDDMKRLSRDLEMLSEISFPRQALNEQDSYGLHIFCDSSVESYGFAAYALDENSKGSFLFSKSKLAPLSKGKEHSVPTLELMGVILAYKCLPSILEAYHNIQFQFVNISVDAQVVLNWLLTKESKVKSKFVRNRILEADAMKDKFTSEFGLPIMYHYVNTEENPADLITRGLAYHKYLSKMKFWLEGPVWLTNNFEKWPQYPLLSISPDHKCRVSTACTVQANKVNTGILNINKFSDFEKLLKCTGYLYKFLSKKQGFDPKKRATEYWIKNAQSECFANEINFLKESNKNVRKVPPLVMNLNLFLDENGILRSRGRITKCLYFNFDVHNPVLLPKNHKFTSLLIRHCHLKMQHLGVGTTLNFLREQGYWIPKGRMAVKSELNSCTVCKKYNALAFKYPKFTDMPKHHMNLVKPFQHVGVDYTGHFWVKDDTSDRSVKMFVLVFTCLNVRAVHFELLPDMSTNNFVMAFQRFCNMYSIPQYLYSDNAKAFLKGGSILEKSLQSEEFKSELEKCNIKHIKIPLYSAWVGSAWERLIRVLKQCLYKVVGRAKLTYFQLLTTLSNIKLAINSRPLTYRSSSEKLEFITPNSFLKLHGNSSLILRDDEKDVWVDDQNQPALEKTIEVQEEIIENFKKLWYESYLLSLREHSRNLYQNQWENRIRIGDIVLLKAINKPRPFWMMGKVLELVMGFDGKIRSVKIKQGNGSIEYHSICNLYPMELSVTHAIREQNGEQNRDQNNVVAVNEAPPDRSVRPKRKATERFNRMLRDDIDYL